MSLSLHKLHPLFVAEVGAVDLRQNDDRDTLETIRAALDDYAVLVFHDQPFTEQEQMAFAERLDGELHTKTGSSVFYKSRFGTEAIADISNVDKDNTIFAPDDRRRMYSLANRLWHTDASFQDPAGRYSMLSAKVIPTVDAGTEYADMRAAYDALDDEMKARLEGLHAHHSIAYSREILGFEFNEHESAALKGACHPLIRELPRSHRKSLYVASHATKIVDWPVPEGRLLLRELIEHATQREFVYRHKWKVDDFVIYDNRATMHRGIAFDDTQYRRELRRVTTLDVNA